jgi:hypothetical protein
MGCPALGYCGLASGTAKRLVGARRARGRTPAQHKLCGRWSRRRGCGARNWIPPRTRHHLLHLLRGFGVVLDAAVAVRMSHEGGEERAVGPLKTIQLLPHVLELVPGLTSGEDYPDHADARQVAEQSLAPRWRARGRHRYGVNGRALRVAALLALAHRAEPTGPPSTPSRAPRRTVAPRRGPTSRRDASTTPPSATSRPRATPCPCRRTAPIARTRECG